jgi:murein DD-endopeptidase MepM/ murein hydrolase activator NlpD
MRGEEWKARDKITQKMSHEGLVEQNQATGEKHSISQQEEPLSFERHESSSVSATQENPGRLDETSHPDTATPLREAPQQSFNHPASDDRPPGGNAGVGQEKPTVKAGDEKLRQHATKYDSKLAEARKDLPAGRTIRLKQEANETGKMRHRLRFDKELRPQDAFNPLAALAKGAAFGTAMTAHSKIQEAEQGNDGIEAGHKIEQSTEALTSQSARFLYRRAKTSPYRHVAKLERKATRANVNYLYRQALEKNPALKSSLLSRFLQKQRIKRQYAKTARMAQSGAKGVAKGTASAVGKIGRLVRSLVGPHRKVLIIVVIILFALFFISSLVSSCSAMLTSGFNSIASTSFTASDADINQAEAYYTQLEANLKEQIDNAEQSHPGYDEYDYQVGAIGHDPYELISYLTAMYGQFTFDQVKPILQELFSEQYQLSFVPQTETRNQTVTTTDPTTGETTTTQQPSTYTVLNVNLNATPFSEVVSPLLNQAGVTDMYNGYIQSRGNRQYFATPFSFDWNPYVDSINSDEVAQIDIPEGTQVLSMLNGTVTQASGGTVVIDDGAGLHAVFSGCGSLSVHVGQAVKIGDGIAASGSDFSISVSNNGTALNPILFILDPDAGSNEVTGTMPLSGSVGNDRQLVEQLAGQYGMQDYINLILAVMQQESGGQGGDPMQASEGPYNTQYPHRPDGITDPSYSIQCGIQELKASLQLAGCTSPTDMAAIDLALQGYNFGSGFIPWAHPRGGYSEANAQAFSQMEAADLGWSSYGDPDYVPHVLRYYKNQ